MAALPATAPALINGKAALRLASLGLHVFPCQPDKRPQPGLKWTALSSRAEDQVRRWWHAQPQRMLTGFRSSLSILEMQPNTALPTMLALWSAGCHLTLSKVSPQIMSGACNRRSRLAATVTLALPASLKTPADLAEAQASILTAMGSGDITTDEAADAAKVIEAVGAAMERRELEARIAALETKEAGK